MFEDCLLLVSTALKMGVVERIQPIIANSLKAIFENKVDCQGLEKRKEGIIFIPLFKYVSSCFLGLDLELNSKKRLENLDLLNETVNTSFKIVNLMLTHKGRLSSYFKLNLACDLLSKLKLTPEVVYEHSKLVTVDCFRLNELNFCSHAHLRLVNKIKIFSSVRLKFISLIGCKNTSHPIFSNLPIEIFNQILAISLKFSKVEAAELTLKVEQKFEVKFMNEAQVFFCDALAELWGTSRSGVA